VVRGTAQPGPLQPVNRHFHRNRGFIEH
jgi:hypothetical protein